jgi:hypothetical protein
MIPKTLIQTFYHLSAEGVPNNPLELHPGLDIDSNGCKSSASVPLHHFHSVLDGIAQEPIRQWLQACQLPLPLPHPP